MDGRHGRAATRPSAPGPPRSRASRAAFVHLPTRSAARPRRLRVPARRRRLARCRADDLHRASPTASTASQVRAVDAAGNADDSPAAHSWTVDTVAPADDDRLRPRRGHRVALGAFTYGRWRQRVAATSAGSTTPAGPRCPAGYTGLDAGEHRFQVRATDGAGNADDSPAGHTWTIDLTAPTTTLTEKPRRPRLADTARFRLTATDAGGSTVAGFECRLDGGAFGPARPRASSATSPRGAHVRGRAPPTRVGNVEDPAVALHVARHGCQRRRRRGDHARGHAGHDRRAARTTSSRPRSRSPRRRVGRRAGP